MNNPLQKGFPHRGNSSSHSRPQTLGSSLGQQAYFSPSNSPGFDRQLGPKTLDSDQQPFQQPFQAQGLAAG